MQFGPAAGEVRCRSCHGSIRGRTALLCADRQKLRNADALPEARRAIGNRRRSIARRASALCRLLDTTINHRIDIDAFMVQPTRVLRRAWVRGLSACKYPLVTKLQRGAAFRNVATHEAQAPLSSPHPWASIFFAALKARSASRRGVRYSGGAIWGAALVDRAAHSVTLASRSNRSPDERSDIRGFNPACRCAHSGYRLSVRPHESGDPVFASARLALGPRAHRRGGGMRVDERWRRPSAPATAPAGPAGATWRRAARSPRAACFQAY